MESLGGYCQPDVLYNANNQIRKVGFEIEFNGLELDQAVNIVQQCYSGEIITHSRVQKAVQALGLGTFIIELDWDYLKQKAAKVTLGSNDDWVEQLGSSATIIVPLEVVCPPVPVNELNKLDTMLAAFQSAGATGTDDMLIAAYGVHINADVPDMSAGRILYYIKAFCLLQWWLVETHQVDLARKATPFIDLYPHGYVKKVLSKTDCELPVLIDDYLMHNATRNRALDLLPLFAYLDEKRLKAKITDDKVNARPTFHYRLPNCHIGRKDWSLAEPWSTWCVVEKLAQSPKAVDELSKIYLQKDRPFIGVSRKGWVVFMNQWLQDNDFI